MTKQSVLEMFASSSRPIKPDEVCRHFGKFRSRSSVYSYLFRLHKQGLLKRGQIGGRIVYTISDRGIERLKYFQSESEKEKK